MLDDALHQRCLLVYMDEVHVHLDTDEGYGWSIRRKRFWVSSSSPGLKKVPFYGLYFYNLGQVRIWPYAAGNQDNSIEVLDRLRTEFPNIALKLVWDGEPYHRAYRVRDSAHDLDITIAPLPAYSPAFMPVEHLWHWLREEVTYHTCYEKEAHLIAQVEWFQKRVNADPIAISDRLWVTTRLKKSEEKLRFST